LLDAYTIKIIRKREGWREEDRQIQIPLPPPPPPPPDLDENKEKDREPRRVVIIDLV